MSKKIVIIVNKGNFFLSHRLNIAERAIREGYEVHLISDASKIDLEKIIRKGIKFHQVPFSRTFKNLFIEIKTLLLLFRILIRVKPQLIHNVTIKPIIYVNLVCKILHHKEIINSISGLGYIFVNKNIKNSILKFFILRLYKFFFNSKTVRVILQNEEEKNFLIRSNITHRNNLRLIPGAGVDTSKYRPPKKFVNKNIIVFAARMIKEKGAIELVQAANKLVQMNYNLKVILLGKVDNEYPTHIKESVINKWCEKSFIEWHGNVDNVIPYYQKASIVCMPSYYSEGVPKALIEAASIGKPIITSDMPGCRSIVKHNFNGILVEPRNIDSLVNAIKFLLDNPKVCEIYGLNGRKHAITTFDEKRIVDLTLGIYKEII